MNDLSWLIYFADLSSRLSVLSSITAFLSMFAAVVYSLYHAIENEEFKVSYPLLSVFVVSALVCSVLPTRETVYAIAASELGEEVLKSSTATKAQQALDTWLDTQIEELTKEQKGRKT